MRVSFPNAAAALLVALLVPPSARAEDRTMGALERVLAARREAATAGKTSRTAAPDLGRLIERLAERDRAQRAEFDEVARRELPPKAEERLVRTRQAWVAGQGRLLRLLRDLVAGEAADAATGRRPAVRRGSGEGLDEALALVRRLRAASRAEPLSQGELKVRSPELRPPPLSVGLATQMTAGDAPPIGSIAPEIRRQAETLDGPVEIYEWVRHAIRPAFYHGVMKGPRQTLLEGSGNDADTAALLIALLRAKGLPARYVRGTVDLGPDVAMALTGTTGPERALRVFERAGIPVEALGGAGGLSGLRVERVWAEAYIPFANYRGVLLDTFEKTWVPLDAGFKRLEPPTGLDVRTLGFDAEEVFDDSLAAPSPLTPREVVRQRVEALLADQAPGTDYEATLVSRAIVAQNLGHLPSSLPYRVEARAEVGYDPPASLVHTARFVVESSQSVLLDASFSVPSLLGQRLTLSWVPLEEEDQMVVDEYGGLFATPPYLVEVKPVLKLGGVTLSSGLGGAGLGVKVDFRIELETPGVTDAVDNRVVAGNLTAVGLAAGEVTTTDGEDEAARLLARLAFRYLERWDASDDELAALLRVVPVRPTVSTCLVQSAVQVEYAGGDPLYPVRYDWRGLSIDADHRPSAPVGIEDEAAVRDFLLLSGLEGSVLEARLFEDDLDITSVSTARALQLAPGQGIEVLDLEPGSADLILPELPLDEGVKAEIREASAAGYRVRVPAAPVRLLAWSGSGYLILDDATGESAWQLQGGHSGGTTTPAVIDLPAELVDTVWRQSESPAPQPGGVTVIQKYDSTDYQLGTVDTLLERPLRVLVTDEEGYPVPGAPVTFSVLAGGGHLVDPATGRADQTEVTVFSCAGDEEQGPCASLKPGEAVMTLRLGARTDGVPRYTCEEPFTCTCPEGETCDRDAEGIGYMTQVGLNLVTARAGPVALGEPFTSIAYPESLPAEDGAGIQVQVRLLSAPKYNPVNLTVPDRLALGVTDRHGNPLSNVWTRVAFHGPPWLGPLAEGRSYTRPANDTPGHVLKLRDYETCTATHPSVVWGRCPNEAEIAVTRSSSQGALFYPIVGDSPYSYYRYDYGTTLSPEMAWIAYHTNGFTCPRPDATQCAGSDQPFTLVWQGPGGGRVNDQGNLVEAYPPGDRATLELWADVVYEEARVERTVDAQGNEHFRVEGTNTWRRDHLLDSEFELRPLTPGTGVAPTAAPLGDGRYAAEMTLASTPELNVAGITGTHYAPLIGYVGSYGGDVDPATVDPLTMTVERVRDPDRPTVIDQSYDLWGAEARITDVDPSPVFLGDAGTVTRPSVVRHQILPPEYAQLLSPRDVWLDVHAAADDALVLAGSGADPSPFVIPAGLSLPSGAYYAQMRLQGVSSKGADLQSDRFPLPVCSLLDLETPRVRMSMIRDPLNERLCGSEGRIRFELCREAQVTLTVGDRMVDLMVDGAAPGPVVDLALGPGLHEVIVPVGLPELDNATAAPFTVEARDATDPLQTAVARGRLEQQILNRSVLPVGHTFVKGVDLLDGHVVHQATDLQVPGRHLGLELTRTYSSAGWDSEGPLGGGWSLAYASRLFEDGQCDLATVVTADGSSQVFNWSEIEQEFTPQKGYHTRLEREGIQAYRFIDKAGNVHHFETRDPELALRLDFVEEPHGDRLVFTYDGASRLEKVAEVHPETGEVRALELTYETIFGSDRVVRAEIPALGLSVDYDYDERGNLTRVTRSGANLPGAEGPSVEPRIEEYEYLPPRPLDPTAPPQGGTADPYDPRRDHQLSAIVDANENRREFVYFSDSDPPLPGEEDSRLPTDAGGLSFTYRWELAREVVEHPDPGLSERTEFTYDGTDYASARWTTTVRDARGHDTVYVLNGNGSPVEIQEPLGRRTEMRWDEEDIFKVWEKDPLGRETEFEYDDRGNLIVERILSDDFGLVITEYQYDPNFNKLTYKKDANDHVTQYEIDSRLDDETDPGTGDLLSTTDAMEDVTVFVYDAHGRLETVTDPRGKVTTHTDHDSFGNARTVTDPLGNVTSRVWDERGRLLHQADTFGREMRQVWDGLDRPVRVTRVAGSDSDDETTDTDYFPGGQVRLTRNPNGAETTFTLDGLNRVVATETRFDDQVLTTATTYDANGNKETETDRRGVVRRHHYDALNRLERTEIVAGRPGEGPLGTIAEYTYDLVGNKRSETNLAGLTTRFEYDGLYRVTDRILPETDPTTGQPYRETMTYDEVGNLKEETDADGRLTSYQYDKLDRLTRTTNALSQEIRVAYEDPEGSHVNKSEEHDVTRGLRTTYLYDALNRETERVVHLEGEGGGGASYTTTTAYDDSSHSMTVTDPRGTPTLTHLDGLDRPVEVTVDPGGLALVTRTAYDGLGNRKSVVDPNQHETRFHHDGLGRLVEVMDPAGNATTSVYDGEGLKVSETDRRGIERVFTHDNVGRLRTESLAEAPLSGVPWSREIQYRDRERQRLETNARGFATTFDLDGLDRVVKETDALGFFRTFTWDGVDEIAETDKREAPGGGHYTTLFEYDALHRLRKVTDPLDQVIETVYEDDFNRRTETDKRGIVTVTQLDPHGRVVSVTRAVDTPDEAVLETNVYDGNSNRTRTTDAEGRKIRFTYDAANRVEARTDGAGTPAESETRYRYDGVGNVMEEQDARAAALGEPWSLQRTYDPLDRLETETDGEGNTTGYGYDPEGNRTSVQEPKGQETEFAYGERGELLSVTQPAPEPGAERPVTTYSYDENRNRLSQTDANGNVVEMEYDELDRLQRTLQDPGGFALVTETTRFDANGNPEEMVDPKGQVTTSTYDELNRLKKQEFAFAPEATAHPWRYTSGLTFEYDENANLVQVDESVASGTDPPELTTLTTLRTYDLLDRLETETTTLPNGGPRTVRYTYYRNGTRQSVTDPDERVTRYTYDGKNRLETATTAFGTPEAATTSYGYFPDDLLETVAYPNGVTATHAYDEADRLLSLTNTSGASVVSSYEYFGTDGAGEPISYDANGNRLIQVETNGGLTETTRYGYDDLNRLKSVTYPADSVYPEGRVVGYTYDAVGNRIRETETEPGGAVLADRQGIFDSLNRLESLTDLSKPEGDPERETAFTWDANGNQLTKTVGTGAAAVTTTYVYDLRDKLVQAEQVTAANPGDVSILGRFQYDFDGRRTLKIGESGLRQYVHDDTSLFAEYDATGLQTAKYDYGSDRLISLTHQTEGRRYYSLDGLRSVVNLTDDTGSTIASYHLDAWGNFRFPEELTASRNRFAFTGHIYDPETDLYNAKARYFDPKLGRFLTQDSYLGTQDNPPSLHRYLYANANPLRFIDPTGFAGFEAKAIQYEGFRPSPYGYTEALEFSQEVTVTDSLDASYAVPQMVGNQLGGLNQAAETTVRGAGVAGLAVGAGVLAVTPVPGARAGAAYLGIRAVDEGQAFVRELATGTPTTSFAHQGVARLYEAGGSDPGEASFNAGLTLMGADFAVGLAAGVSTMRAKGSSAAPEGTVVESPTQIETTAPVGFESTAAYQAEWARLAVQERTATIRTQLGRSASHGETYAVQVVRTPSSENVHVVVSHASAYGRPGKVSLLPGEELTGRRVTGVDAEVKLDAWNAANSAEQLAVGATQRVCAFCQLTYPDAPVATPRQPFTLDPTGMPVVRRSPPIWFEAPMLDEAARTSLRSGQKRR